MKKPTSFYKKKHKIELYGLNIIQQNKNYDFLFDKIYIEGTPNFFYYIKFKIQKLKANLNLTNNLLSNEIIMKNDYFLYFPVIIQDCEIGKLYSYDLNKCETCFPGDI